MKCSETVIKTMALVAKLFKGKKDKGGEAYLFHLLRVMGRVRKYNNDDLMVAALLHDAVEDHVTNFAELKNLGYSDRVLRIVEVLTHDRGDSYEQYIKKISADRDAVIVKLADLRDNMDVTRLKLLEQKDLERLQKYHKSYTFLNSKL